MSQTQRTITLLGPLTACFLLVACTERATAPTKTYTIAVSGTAAEQCDVVGAHDRQLGQGAPAALSYGLEETAAEEMVIVHCSDALSAAILVGAESAVLTKDSSAIAELIRGASLRPGTRLIVGAMQGLLERSDSAQQLMVLKSLAQFLHAADNVLEDPSPAEPTPVTETATSADGQGSKTSAVKSATTATDVATLLVNMGQPVLIETLGGSGIISACNNSAAATLSSDAVAVDGSAYGLSGCLVYNQLYAITDLNDPLFAPDNVPESFRSVATESGVIAELVKGANDNKIKYSLSNLHQLIYTTLGYTVISEDDEGVVTDQSVSQSELEGVATSFTELAQGVSGSGNDCAPKKSYICHIPPGNPSNAHTLCIGKPALDAHIAHGDALGLCPGADPLDSFKAFRFHTGYNPSGGWEIDAAAAKGSVPSECTDSDPQTVCPVDPLRYDFDGAAIGENANGDYILAMEWRDGAFVDHAWVVDLASSTFYRDAFYQRVSVPITASDYTPINYRNLLYDACLDPMTAGALYGKDCYGGGDQAVDSAPWSSATFMGLYPGLDLVDNAFLYPTPEIVARLALLMVAHKSQGSGAWGSIPTFEAFALLKLFTRGMTAIPLTAGPYAIPIDHGKTLKQWDAAVTAWLKAAN